MPLWGATVVAVLAVASSACDGCAGCSGEAVAELVDRSGSVDRDEAAPPGEWSVADVGATFAIGDGLRTGAGSEARLTLIGGAGLDVEPDTVIRFLGSMPESPLPGLEVETGAAVLESAEGGSLRTSIGAALLEPGTRLRLSASEGGTRYEVLVGRAEIEHSDGTTQLGSGGGLLVEVGGAIVEEEHAMDAGPPAPGDAGPPPDAGVDPEAASGEIRATVTGRGVRAREEGERRWRRVAPGQTTLAPGTSLRLPRRATVEIRRGDARGVLRGRGDFVVGDGDSLVRSTSGEVELESGAADVRVRVPGGVIVARAGSAGEASVRGPRTTIRAERGELGVRAERGEEVVLRPGESTQLGAAGRFEGNAAPPDRVLLVVNAGSSFTVRDPRPPTAVGFRLTPCRNGGLAELVRTPGTGTFADSVANVYVPPGVHAYRIRCRTEEGGLGEPVADGRVRVVRDSGRAQLPRLPPATVVDTDGRRYTVLYQNLLPEITVRWRDAPETGPYRLTVVRGNGSSETVDTSSPRHSFRSGEIGEGQHRLRFSAADGARASAETTLLIGFDNAAPTAMLRDPEEGSFSAGDTVRVAGVALEGWQVSVEGVPIQLDAQQRFDANVAVPPGRTGLAVRLAHPSRGIHYYIRHARD